MEEEEEEEDEDWGMTKYRVFNPFLFSSVRFCALGLNRTNSFGEHLINTILTVLTVEPSLVPWESVFTPLCLITSSITHSQMLHFSYLLNIHSDSLLFVSLQKCSLLNYFFLLSFPSQESILPLHQGVLFVFLVALAEATSWYAAYQTINLTGQPYCCPFPKTVVASLVLQASSLPYLHYSPPYSPPYPLRTLSSFCPIST